MARGAFEHPGSPKGSPNSLLELWVAFRTSPSAVASISTTLKNLHFYIVFDVMKMHLDLLGYALWKKKRLNAFMRS